MLSHQNHSFKIYSCSICYRRHSKLPPNGVCTRIRCEGLLNEIERSEENYDLNLFQSEFMMLIPKEHTAQVPNDIRLSYEDEFKKINGKVNCLVATPTLELGVDIGSFDVVLQRNIPPTPANYLQRAGRSGRRNKTGVVFSYARTLPHDTHFFSNPASLLTGNIKPPKFNLRNQVMVRKHVHSIVLSVLYNKLNTEDNSELSNAINPNL